MSKPRVDDWVTEYYKWLKDNTFAREANDGWTEIATPFLDRHNDGIVIYVRREGDFIMLSDDGYTISDLDSSGCSIITPRRQQIMLGLLSSLGVQFNEGELTTKATDSNFAQKKHSLIQAILSVNDMFMLNRNQVSNIFLEDLTLFLDDNNVLYSPSVHCQGISGMLHRFDFSLPKTKTKPQRYISAVNSPNQINSKLALFNWQDVLPNRSPDGILYVFLNDNRKVSQSAIDAYRAYKVEPVLWSKRIEYLDKLIS